MHYCQIINFLIYDTRKYQPFIIRISLLTFVI
nr:MAG TPA: hypothetical protein [Crassvirales sp.]